jgi:hypothetical protein
MPASYNDRWSIFKAWKSWKAARLHRADSDVCSEGALLRMAHGLGVPAAQIRWVSSYSPDPISLLERRMEALSLNPVDVTHIEPLTVRELQHRCVRCEKRGRCALDLADEVADPGWQRWREYCPSAATLMTLSILRGCK